MACIMPGIKPSRVKRILIQKAGLMPTVKKTPKGGNIIAKIMRRMLIVDLFGMGN